MNAQTIARLVNQFAAETAASKRAAEKASATKAKLLELGVGTHLGTEHKVVVSESQPIRFDVAAFKEAHPTLHAEFNRAGDVVTSVRIYGR
jgi:hypothetical protein